MESKALSKLPKLQALSTKNVPFRKQARLHCLKRDRRAAIERSRTSSVAAVSGIMVTGFLCRLLFQWGSVPIFFGALLLLGISVLLLAILTGMALKSCWRDARAFMRIKIPPRLVAEAEDERALSQAVWTLNAHIMSWNEAVAFAEREDVEPSILANLKVQRGVLEAKRKKAQAILEAPKPLGTDP